MRWFLNLSTSAKLYAGFGLMIVSLAVVAAAAYRSVTLIQESQKALYEQAFTDVVDIHDVRDNQIANRADMLSMMVPGGRVEVAVLEKAIRERTKEADEGMRRLLQRNRTDPERLEKLQEFEALRQSSLQTRETQTLPLVRVGKLDEARQLHLGVQAERDARMEAIADAFLAQTEQAARTALAVSEQAAKDSVHVLSVAVIIAVLLAFAMTALLNRVLSEPLKEISAAAGRVAAGDLTASVSASARADETGVLMRTFARMLASLREMTAGLHRAQVLAKLAHVITRPDGSFESWSATLPQLVGVESARMPRSTREWLDMLHPDDREKFKEKSIAAATTGERLDLEYRLKRGDGAWIDLRQALEPMQGEPDAQGRTRWFSTLQDVTEQKQAGEKLRASESLKGAILEASLDCIVTMDHEGKIVEFNPAAERTFGYTREQAIGSSMAELIIPPRLRDAHHRGLAHYLATGEGPVLGRRLELEAIRADGTEFPIELAITPIRSGSTPLFTGFIRDITERKEAQERINRLNRVNEMLSSVNGAIVRIRDRQELYQEACRIAVETGGLRFAWLCVVDEDEMRLKPVASAGADEGYLDLIRGRLSLRDDTPEGHGIAAKAVRQKRVLVVNDAQSDPNVLFKKEHAARGIRSTAVLPLSVAGKVVGTFGLHSEEVGFFDDQETKLIDEIAGNIAFALDHIEKEEKVERLNRVYAVLSGINSMIVRVRDRDELFREACRIAIELGQFRLVFIGLVDEAAQQIRPVAWAGDHPDLAQRPRPLGPSAPGREGTASQAIRLKRPVVENNITADSRTLTYPEEVLKRGYRSVASFPLVVGDKAVGVVGLFAGEPGYFDAQEIKLLQELAGDIAFALDHIEQEEKVRRLTRVQAVLSGINAAIVRIRDQQQLFEEACRIAVEAGQLRLAWIGIVDPKREVIAPAAFSGIEQGWLRIIRLSIREDGGQLGMAGRAIRDRSPVVSNDLLADERALFRKESAERGYRSLAMIPLIVHGEAFGVLGLHAAEAGFFSQEELKLLTELAGDIAFGLEHIAHEEKVKHLTRVYAVLSGINALIVRVRDRDELFREACRIAVEAGKFPKAWIGMIERDSQTMRVAAGHGADALFFENLGAMLKEDTAQGNGVVACAVRQRQPVISNDLEHDQRVLGGENAAATGSRSLVVLPLVLADDIAGVLVLHAGVPGFFDDDEMKLLLELAGDISFALGHLQKAEKLNYLAYYDELTGLANSTLFHERLEQHVQAAGAAKRKLAVFVVNVDRFKSINDAFGRQAGDELLKQIASRFAGAGSGDASRLARIGADEFAGVVPEVQSEEHFARLTELRFKECFGPAYRIGDQELRISAKLGIALFPHDGTAADTLFRNAEAALKKAKATGERYMFYTPQMTERIAEKLSLENKLRQALEKEEFVLHYQPKVALEKRAIVGVEALIRWQSPELGLVAPGKFIPLLEETGLILEVGSWALTRAALDHRAWVEMGIKPPRVAVNVSAIQLRQRDFVNIVERALLEGMAPVAIDLEITESLIMEDVEATIEKLKNLQALGIKMAIDDFGTGYSSLAYLAKLPVETVKIDRSFVITMLDDPDTATMVQMMITLAHSLKLTVVAEGVDSEDQAKVLRLLRCDQMQGYLFSKPLPETNLVAMLTKARQAV